MQSLIILVMLGQFVVRNLLYEPKSQKQMLISQLYISSSWKKSLKKFMRCLPTLSEDLDIEFILQHFNLWLFVNEGKWRNWIESYRRTGF